MLLTLAVLMLAAVATVSIQPPPIVDDAIFAESSLTFAKTGSVFVSGLSSPTAVFEAIWGGWFADAFGHYCVSLRPSTAVLFAASGPFLYSMCRPLGDSRRASLLALAG